MPLASLGLLNPRLDKALAQSLAPVLPWVILSAGLKPASDVISLAAFLLNSVAKLFQVEPVRDAIKDRIQKFEFQ